MTPDEMAAFAAALLRNGEAVEIDLRYRGTPVVPVTSAAEEERAALGERAASAWDGPPAVPLVEALTAALDAHGRGPRRVLWPATDPDQELPAMPAPCVYISHTETWTSPEERWPRDTDKRIGTNLGDLLNRVSGALTRPAGVMLLDGDMPGILGLGGAAGAAGAAQAAAAGAAQAAARAAGWEITEIRPWTIAVRRETVAGNARDRVIHIGVLPWLEPATVTEGGAVKDLGTFPLWSPDDVALTMWRAWKWWDLLGEPYHGEQAGNVGIALMRDHYRGRKTPRWLPDMSRVLPARQATEKADRWTSGADHGLPWEHAYDVTTDHLSAAGLADLAVGELRYSEPRTIDARNAPGYYEVILPDTWAYADRMPHPAGAGREPGERLWVSAPTLDLLYECAHGGTRYVPEPIMPEPRVVAAWTGEGQRVLREWSATISGAYKDAAKLTDDPQFRKGIQQVYRGALGLLRRTGGRVFRPDWHHAVVATARCNLWRKVWLQGITSGRWPIEINADAVWYASMDADPYTDWPDTFKRGEGVPGGTELPQPGAFTHKGNDSRKASK